ncbi:hypothetical protein EBZ80_25415, partial [bacterium]|nr:hypothetical protein [bacterium]
LSDHWNLGQAPDGETVFVRLSKFEWSMRLGSDNFKNDYHALYGALEYLKSISPVKALYGVKIADEEAKRNDNLICFHEALDKYVREFLVANPDKAQMIADRKAARVFFVNRWGDAGWKNFGNFFETDDLFRWFESLKNKPSLISKIDPKSPFRIYMEHIYRMLGGDKARCGLGAPQGSGRLAVGKTARSTKHSLIFSPSHRLI